MFRIRHLIALALLGVAAAPPAAARIVEGFTAGADQVKIHYREAGPKDARRTLLLIPGWRMSASIWSNQLDDFSARKYRVVAMDPRSQGGSTVLASGNTPENRSEDIRGVISGLELKHVVLVGWSQAAQDVAAYVERFGTGAVDGLALIDTPVSAGPGAVASNPESVKDALRGIAAFSRAPRDYSEGMVRAIISAPIPPEMISHLVEEAMKTPPDISIAMLVQDFLTVDRRPALKKFDKPTLVVASGESGELEEQRQMAAALPRGRFVVIPHAAHAVFVDQPAAFNRELEKFVSALSGAGPGRGK